MYATCMASGNVQSPTWRSGSPVGEPQVQRQRGKWVLRQGGYDPATGKRRVRQLATFPTKRAAVAQQKAVAAGRAGTDAQTLGEFLESVWLPAKEGRVEASTYDQYDWAVRRHVVPLLGSVRLRDLTAEVLDGWLRELTLPNQSGKPRLGSTSIRLVRNVCKMYGNFGPRGASESDTKGRETGKSPGHRHEVVFRVTTQTVLFCLGVKRSPVQLGQSERPSVCSMCVWRGSTSTFPTI
jgi:hypothetical protein